MFLIRFLKGTPKLELLNAGHTFPFMIDAEEKLSFIQARSNMLGLLDDFSPHMITIDFPKNAAIVLYTDGLVEARSAADEAYGIKRIKKLFSKGAAQTSSMQHVMTRIINDWSIHTKGVDPQDDLCLVAIKSV